MQKVTAEHAAMAVHSGQVELTADQARTRLHALQPVKVGKNSLAGVYAVTSPIQFKKGETFGFDGEIAKDGRLHDPEAEELAKAEAEKAAEIRERHAYDRGVADAKASFEAEQQELMNRAFAAGKEAGIAEAAGNAVDDKPAEDNPAGDLLSPQQ